MKQIVVIGDSHIRAFAYNDSFIPLFIGPAAFNNFLTKENQAKVESKIGNLLDSSSGTGFTLMFLFSGDVEHICRSHQEWDDSLINLIRDSAVRYCETVRRISTKFNQSIVVAKTLPGGSEFYTSVSKIYADVVQRSLADLKLVKVVDLNAKLLDERGFLASSYKADFAHINHRTMRPIIEVLIEENLRDKDGVNFDCDFKWWSSITIPTNSGPFKIWGDTYRDELIIEPYEKLVLKFLQKRSRNVNRAVNAALEVFQKQNKSGKVCVLNAKQGQIPFLLLKNFDPSRIKAIELSARNCEMIKSVSRLMGFNYESWLSTEIGEIDKGTSLLIDMNWWKTTRKIQNEVVTLISKCANLQVIAIVTHDMKSDQAIFARKLGFNWLSYQEPTFDGLTFMILEKGRPVDSARTLFKRILTRLDNLWK